MGREEKKKEKLAYLFIDLWFDPEIPIISTSIKIFKSGDEANFVSKRSAFVLFKKPFDNSFLGNYCGDMQTRNDVSELQKHLGYWMRMISNQVSFSFARKLEKLNVTVAEWVLLRHLYSQQDVVPPSEVAELTGLSRGAVSKLIDRLVEKSLIQRKESARDRRFQEIRLSARARHLVPELARLADENDDHFFGVLSPSEQAQLRRLLLKIADKKELQQSPLE